MLDARDANDVLHEEGVAALRAAFDASERFVPDQRPSPNSDKLTPTVWHCSDPTTLPKRQWVYGRQLMRGTLSVTVAPGGVGKSALAITEALAIASGRPLLGEAVPEGPLRVWYINCEDPETPQNPELSRRMLGACVAHDLTSVDLGDRVHLDSAVLSPLKLAGPGPEGRGFIIHEDEFDRIEKEVRAHRIDVLVIDPFISTHDLNENDNPMIDRLVKRLIKLATTCNCAVSLVHHTRKTDGGPLSAESARGASALVAAARMVRVLQPMTAEQGEGFELQDQAYRRYFQASLDKQNMAAPLSEQAWFEMVSVDLGNGPGPSGTGGDEVGVPQPWRPPDHVIDVSPDTIAEVQAAIDGKGYRRSNQSLDWVGFAIAPILGIELTRQPPKAPKGHTRVTQHLKAWIQAGWLAVAETPNPRRGGRVEIVEVGNRIDAGETTP